MKFKNKMLSFLLLATAATSCVDDFEEINSDPNKLYEITLQSIFPGTVYRTMDKISELNLNRMLSYSRHVTIGYAQGIWNDTRDGNYRTFYVDILRDLNDLDKKYENDANSPNFRGVVKTWKAFVYYQMISLWGPVGLSDYGLQTSNKRSFKYDSEEFAYEQVLAMLDAAVDSFDPSSSNTLLKDPVYDGDITKWRKFANTLRLEIAMNIQNISEEKSRAAAAKSMEHEDWIFSSLEDALDLKYGTTDGTDGSFYYTRWYKNYIYKDNWGNIPSMNEYFATYLFSYQDPRMETYFEKTNFNNPDAAPYRMPDYLTRPHDCEVSKCSVSQMNEHLALIMEGKELRDSLWIRYSIDYVPTPDGAGTRLVAGFGWEAAFDPTDPSGQRRVSDPLSMPDQSANPCYIKEKYYKIDTDLLLLRWADACFLCAEAKLKYGLGAKSAQEYYENGILASFIENGIENKAAAYMAQDGVKWNTNGLGFYDTRKLFRASIMGEGTEENHLEQVYKQRYFADFMDGLSVWRMERRTRALDFPPFFLNNGAFEEGGNKDYAYPQRLYFPLVESQTNADAYHEAIGYLQSNSPEPNPGRWGDNVFTVLHFAKPVPNVDEKVEKWRSIQYVEYNMEMQEKKYGRNYEEFVRTAREMTGITDDDEAALEKAFNFMISGVIKTYVVEPND